MNKVSDPTHDGAERRRHPRYLYETALWLEVGPGQELQQLKSVNLSGGGLMLKTNKTFSLGSEVKLHIELPFLLDMITATARVVHVGHEETSNQKLIGIELVEVKGTTQEQMIKFLEELLN